MTEPAPDPLLTGFVVFEGWEPEHNAIVRIEIRNVTYIDAPSESIAAEEFRFALATLVLNRGTNGGARLPFTIWGGEPDTGADYIVTATVIAAKTAQVIGRTIVAYPVITFGNPDSNVEVHVVRTKPAR